MVAVIAIVLQVPKTTMIIYQVMVHQSVAIAIKHSPLEISLNPHHSTNCLVNETFNYKQNKNHKRSFYVSSLLLLFFFFGKYSNKLLLKLKKNCTCIEIKNKKPFRNNGCWMNAASKALFCVHVLFGSLPNCLAKYMLARLLLFKYNSR